MWGIEMISECETWGPRSRDATLAFTHAPEPIRGGIISGTAILEPQRSSPLPGPNYKIRALIVFGPQLPSAPFISPNRLLIYLPNHDFLFPFGRHSFSP